MMAPLSANLRRAAALLILVLLLLLAVFGIAAPIMEKYEAARGQSAPWLTVGVNPQNHGCVSNFVVGADGAALGG